jgi:hypothetical protein
VGEASGGACLAGEEGQGLIANALWQNQFQGHTPAEGDLLCLPDFAHAAASDEAQEVEVADVLLPVGAGKWSNFAGGPSRGAQQGGARIQIQRRYGAVHYPVGGEYGTQLRGRLRMEGTELINIPRIGLRVILQEGEDQLACGVCHEPGVCV